MMRRSIGPMALLGNAAFRRVWLSGALSNINRWLEFLAVGVWVFDRTGSALVVTLMVVLRMLPLALFGAFVGSLAERFRRRTLVMSGLVLSVAASALLASAALSGVLTIWQVALGAFINGVVWAGEMPLRRTMLGDIAGDRRVAAAMGFDTATNNATRMVGPLCGGALLEAVGIGGAFLVGAALNLFSLVLLAGARGIEDHRTGPRSGVFASIRDAFLYIRSNRPLTATLAVTVIYNIWGFPMTSMVPVIGKESLGLSAFPVGVLQSGEGSGRCSAHWGSRGSPVRCGSGASTSPALPAIWCSAWPSRPHPGSFSPACCSSAPASAERVSRPCSRPSPSSAPAPKCATGPWAR